MLPAHLTLTLLSSVTVSPATVPATGAQEAIITVDTPSAVRFTATGASGTACTIVDRVRGPFESSGQVGRQNCELDVLLDAGQYKVRLQSPARGKGQVKLTAVPYQEINPATVQLQPGSGVTTTLGISQTASFWLRLEKKGTPYIHVVGRTAGDVRLWRNGEWLEPLTFTHEQVTLQSGTVVHDWWVDTELEAGEYQLVVYGKNPAGATVDSNNRTLTIFSGFPKGGAERTVSFTLPESGTQAVEVPSDTFAALLMAQGALAQPLQLLHYAWQGSGRFPSPNRCTIEKLAASPQCVLTSSSNSLKNVLMVRGAPGTRAVLEWPASRSGSEGDYTGSIERSFEIPKGAGGQYLIGFHDVPVSIDDAPLGCELFRLKRAADKTEQDKWVSLARSMTKVGDERMLSTQFNYGNGASVWFEATASGKFRIKTSGERKNTCEVYRFTKDGEDRLTRSAPDSAKCDELLALSAGQYVVRISGGLSGIETLTLQDEGGIALFKKAPVKVAPQVSCVFPSMTLEPGMYNLQSTRSARVRGLTVQPLPLGDSAAVPFTLEPGASISVSLGTHRERVVRAVGAASFECALKSASLAVLDGSCRVPAGPVDTLTLKNTSVRPVVLALGSEVTPVAPAAPAPITPRGETIIKLKAGEPAFFDFARRESHSAIFDVETPGLYNVTTQGLLTTECRLRTQVASDFANDRSGGRGRNCLISTMLQKGRYMMTANTVNESTGRAALVMTRNPPKDAVSQKGEGETFFRAEAGELLQQKLVVPSTGDYQLGTTGQGQSLMCRLDDSQGWPIERVPSECVGQRQLKADTYLWTQMPLTVESMRHTSLRKVREPVVLRGKGAHPLEFFTWYDAELGADGKDEFLFSLSGQTTLDVVLSGGMQGRVFLLEPNAAPKAVEVIPASAIERVSEESEDHEEESQDVAERENEDGESDSEGDSPEPSTPVIAVSKAPPPPHGAQITLPAGKYKIVAEHSRGDVGITYRVHLGSLTLLPGMSRTVPTPSSMPIFVPQDGTLRLKTEGEADVRCRLFDSTGKRVLEGSENGADWNCAIAEPVAKGTYRLEIESETQQPGETKVSLAAPPMEDKGVLTAGPLPLGSSVVRLALPPVDKDALQDVQFTSAGAPFSCALEDALGIVRTRQLRTRSCSMVVHPGTEKFMVRLWTTDGAVKLESKVSARAATPLPVPTTGRYQVNTGAVCLPSTEVGALRPCWPEVSLEAGSAYFAVQGSATVPTITEVKGALAETPTQLVLNRRAFLQRSATSAQSIFVLKVSVAHGSELVPACGFDGAPLGHEMQRQQCFAVSRVGTEATARLWVASDDDLPVSLSRTAVTLPGSAELLTAGRRHLAFKGASLFALPSGGTRVRVSVSLPGPAWATVLDDKQTPLEVCPPSTELHRCVMTVAQGKLVIAGAEGEADVNVTLLEGEPRPATLNALFETEIRQPGTLRLPLASAKDERTLAVQGAASCTLELDDGTRVTDCTTRLPAGRAGTLTLETEVGALRATLWVPGRERWVRLGSELPLVPGPSLAPSVASPLLGARIDRTLVVAKDAAVRIAADTGVCALFKGTELLAVEGLDTGCEIVRVLAPGTYRVLVRPFADVPLSGTLSWSSESVTALVEGIGPETWLAPGEARLYRFGVAATGKVGFGVQAPRDSLECTVLSDVYKSLGTGCQQYLSLQKGDYLLMVRQPGKAGAPIAFKPVVLGLSGDRTDIPPEYLQDFFKRTQNQ